LVFFTFLGKFGYNLYSYIYKGPKIDLSLEIFDSSNDRLQTSYKNSPDTPTYMGDAIEVYNFTNNLELILKNTSTYTAYNIKIIEGAELFTLIQPLPQKLSLIANNEFKINCQFIERDVHLKYHELGRHFGVPEYAKNKNLVVSYQNESRNTFYTTFKINDSEAVNTYSLKK
jgi:hypothetical protein